MSEYLQAVARGMVSGGMTASSYGKRVNIGAYTGMLWAGAAYALPSPSGVQMSVVSTSASDAAAGTGIRTLLIIYLDSNLDTQEEIVTLNGLTPVLTVATNIRFVQCVHVVTAGSGKTSAGIITVSNGGQDYAYIPAGELRCPSSVRMVPRGKRLVITGMTSGSASNAAAADAVVYLVSTGLNGTDLTSQGIFIPHNALVHEDSSQTVNFHSPFVFPEGRAVGLSFSVDKAATIVGSWIGYFENR